MKVVGVSVVLAAVASAVAAAGTRYEEHQQFKFEFLNTECRTGTFTDSEVAAKVGTLSVNTSMTKCPQIPHATGTDHVNAYNGVRSEGKRQPELESDDSAISSAAFDTTALGLLEDTATRPITFEFWFVPAFSTSDGGSDQYVLMEVGKRTSDGTELWNCNNNFVDSQLRYNQDADRFELEYRADDGSCQTALFAFNSLTAGNLYHVVISAVFVSVTFPAPSTYHHWVMYVNNGTPVQHFAGGHQASFSNWANSEAFRVGSSPASLSTASGMDTFFSFKGDILMASLHNTLLNSSMVTNNYNAYLPNSAPVPPVAAQAVEVVEDSVDNTVSALAGFYDFDSADVQRQGLSGQTGALTARVMDALTPSPVFGGTVKVDGLLPTEYPAVSSTNITFHPSIADRYSVETADAATFLVAATDEAGALSGNATMSVIVHPSSDPPIATGGSVTVPQASRAKLNLGATDPDCLTGDSVNSCLLFGKDKTVVITALPDHGVVYPVNFEGECDPVNETTTFVLPGDEFTVPLDDPDGRDLETLVLCFEGCLNLTNANSSNPCIDEPLDGPILGTTNLQFHVKDTTPGVPLISNTADYAITVTNVLQAGAPVFETRINQDLFSEPSGTTTKTGFLNVTLKGTDHACESANPIEGCPRAMEFIVTGLPSEGKLYRTEEESSEILASDLPLKLSSNWVMFAPNTLYHNSESWPICDESQSKALTQ